MGQIYWLWARNFTKLCEALREGHPRLIGTAFSDDAMYTTFAVRSSSDPTVEYAVTLRDWWDGRHTSTCDCPYGADKLIFPMDGRSPIPCKHALAAWFAQLHPRLRAAALENYPLLGEAWARGATHDLGRSKEQIAILKDAEQARILASLHAAGLDLEAAGGQDLGVGPSYHAETEEGQQVSDLVEVQP